MEPVYSRDECVATIRDYYEFLAKMFMDSSFIIEPPQDGWPNITRESTKDLGKTEEVIELLRHLPYIESKPYSNHPEGLPGGNFIDWTYVVHELQTEQTHPESELLMSEGNVDQFEGKIPSYCIGLVHGGYLMGNEEPDVILLDTRDGVIYWMDCPLQIQESASPPSSYLVYPLDGESQRAIEPKDDGSDGNKVEESDEDGAQQEDEDESEDESEDEIRWGPCWPVPHFFEMLKNQFRQLNFIPKSENDVVDVWPEAARYATPIPEGFTDTLQAIYRKHGWPDMSKYRKEDCLAEVRRELKENFPEHHRYYYRDGA
jgi:hypothetical protein